MRIPIREQLGLLVLLTSLIALAVVAIATVLTSMLDMQCRSRTDFLDSGSRIIISLLTSG